jgi:hypothetical protein
MLASGISREFAAGAGAERANHLRGRAGRASLPPHADRMRYEENVPPHNENQQVGDEGSVRMTQVARGRMIVAASQEPLLFCPSGPGG